MFTKFEEYEDSLAMSVDAAGSPDPDSADSFSLWLSGLLEEPWDHALESGDAEKNREGGDEQ